MMYKEVSVLNKDEHATLKLEKLTSFEFAKEISHVVLASGEYFQACKSQPILFVQNEEAISSIALLALKENSNLFLDKKNQWLADEYCPFGLRRYPFIFVEAPSQEGESLLAQTQLTLILGFDATSKALSTKKGEALFTDDKEPTQLTKNILQTLNAFQGDMNNTLAFTKKLKELDVLEPLNIEMTVNTQGYKIEGFLRVNEEKFKALPNETKIEMIDNGMYNLITAHLLSLGNFEKLGALSQQ